EGGTAGADRARAWARALGRDRCVAARGAAAPRRLGWSNASVQHTVEAARGAACAARPDPDVLLRTDRLSARAHRKRTALPARDVAAQLATASRLRRETRPQHHRR